MSVEAGRLCVISDLHFGNPLFKRGSQLISFLHYVSDSSTTLCINGDGVDLLQLSFGKFMIDMPDVSKAVRMLSSRGVRIYYIVGNHDIYMEKFLEDWGIFRVCPYLDVVSGDKHIHIEHAHLYDRLFLYNPDLYIKIVHMAGYLVKLSPLFHTLYDRFIAFMFYISCKIRVAGAPTFFEHPQFFEAAMQIFKRGYDVVIFGHTHRPGIIKLPEERLYVNPGCWYKDVVHYVDIDNGKIELKKWQAS